MIGKYLSALKENQNHQTSNLINQKNPNQEGLLGLLGSSDGTLENKEVNSCKQCRHARKPGTVRYCSFRIDLIPAYGAGHPLRQLPLGDGKDCDSFSDIA